MGISLLSAPSWAAYFRVTSGGLDRQGGLLVARAEGAVVRLDRNLTMTVAPGSRLYRVHKRVRLWLSNEGRTTTHVVAIESGRVDVDNATKLERAVLVRTPQKAAVVSREGRMSIVASDERVSVANRVGSVLYAVGGGKFHPVAEDSVTTLTDYGAERTAILPPPRVDMKNTLFGGFSGNAHVGGVSWEPVEGARAYRVSVDEVAEDPAASSTGEPPKGEPSRGEPRHVTDVQTAQLVLTPAPRLGAGRYHLSVRAVDRFGIAGHASDAAPFSVLGVKTSDGGYVDRRGNIVAGYDRRVQLTYASGLVMKGGKQDWRPVPDEIILPSDQPMSLHVREAGDTRMVSTRLMAQRVVTDVVVGPKFIRWPGDAVRVEVTIHGEEGTPQPDWVEPRFRVLLGIDELDVSWSRQPGRFVAEVPPQPGEGPWVVRVEVEDQYGHALGRDFVEIARRHDFDNPLPPAAKSAQSVPAASP